LAAFVADAVIQPVLDRVHVDAERVGGAIHVLDARCMPRQVKGAKLLRLGRNIRDVCLSGKAGRGPPVLAGFDSYRVEEVGEGVALVQVLRPTFLLAEPAEAVSRVWRPNTVAPTVVVMESVEVTLDLTVVSEESERIIRRFFG